VGHPSDDARADDVSQRGHVAAETNLRSELNSILLRLLLLPRCLTAAAPIDRRP
jgi:hypothetical protein